MDDTRSQEVIARLTEALQRCADATTPQDIEMAAWNAVTVLRETRAAVPGASGR